MYLKSHYYLNNSWSGHEVRLVAFHDHYGEDSYNEKLLPEVRKAPPQRLVNSQNLLYSIIKVARHSSKPK